MIKEVIVVEGRADVAAVKKAVEAETISLSGFGISQETFARMDEAYRRCGMIILTDPDFAGEKIRDRLAMRYPKAKHAFISKEEGTKKGDIGVENASAQAIRHALSCARCQQTDMGETYGMEDILSLSLMGTPAAAEKRDRLGRILGIGYGNGKTFLKRLNHYGITPQELQRALEQAEKEEEKKGYETNR